MLVNFRLQFEDYSIECSEEQAKYYQDLVAWWDSMNTDERHECFVRYDNRGLGLDFRYDRVGSYSKLYDNELKLKQKTENDE